MSHRLLLPLPTGSSPLNSTLINLAAQSLAFLHLVHMFEDTLAGLLALWKDW